MIWWRETRVLLRHDWPKKRREPKGTTTPCSLTEKLLETFHRKDASISAHGLGLLLTTRAPTQWRRSPWPTRWSCASSSPPARLNLDCRSTGPRRRGPIQCCLHQAAFGAPQYPYVDHLKHGATRNLSSQRSQSSCLLPLQHHS